MDGPLSAKFEDQHLKSAMAKLSATELQALEDHYYNISPEKTVEIESDLSRNLTSEICRPLVGRYRIYRKLKDDPEYWDDFGDDFTMFSGHLAHEPAIIAAALAIRPEDNWEWMVVEAWSWVYRHAVMLDLDVGAFAEWSADQDPENSRAFVTTALALPQRALPSATLATPSPTKKNKNA